MFYKKVLVITDNEYLLEKFYQIIINKNLSSSFTFAYSFSNSSFPTKVSTLHINLLPINVKSGYEKIIANFDLVISLHCKQLFPATLVRQVKCINIHPGLNPYNRGWFPQVFSIINKLPLGATIHEIDEELDHGPVIDSAQVPVYDWDTSLSAYNRVLEAELQLIERNIDNILSNSYSIKFSEQDGNLNLKKDFEKLCELNLSDSTTMKEAIDRLRALSHGDYQNAFFYDEITGSKIFVTIQLNKDVSI